MAAAVQARSLSRSELERLKSAMAASRGRLDKAKDWLEVEYAEWTKDALSGQVMVELIFREGLIVKARLKSTEEHGDKAE